MEKSEIAARMCVLESGLKKKLETVSKLQHDIETTMDSLDALRREVCGDVAKEKREKLQAPKVEIVKPGEIEYGVMVNTSNNPAPTFLPMRNRDEAVDFVYKLYMYDELKQPPYVTQYWVVHRNAGEKEWNLKDYEIVTINCTVQRVVDGKKVPAEEQPKEKKYEYKILFKSYPGSANWLRNLNYCDNWIGYPKIALYKIGLIRPADGDGSYVIDNSFDNAEEAWKLCLHAAKFKEYMFKIVSCEIGAGGSWIPVPGKDTTFLPGMPREYSVESQLKEKDWPEKSGCHVGRATGPIFSTRQQARKHIKELKEKDLEHSLKFRVIWRPRGQYTFLDNSGWQVAK